MHILKMEDVAMLERSLSKFKQTVSLEEIKSQCDSPILSELFLGMLDMALLYTESVCRFQRILSESRGSFDEQGDRQAIEDVRGTKHDTFIAQVNILCRTMVRQGKSTKWRNSVGDSRAALGRFALMISFEYIKSQAKEGGAT